MQLIRLSDNERLILNSTVYQKLFWLIAISITAITFLQYFSTRECRLHELYRELYYFPLVIAALRYGRKGALICLSSIYLLYIPYIIITWRDSWQEEATRVVELFFYMLLAMGTGYFADREKKIKAELDRNRFITSLGRITSAIVHDLKNPLISIIGLLERLAKGKGDCSKYVPVILEDAHRMERIVYDVLDFARPVNIKKENTELSDIVKNAVAMCSEKAEKAGVAMETSLDEIHAGADPFLLERALVNVISNAIEASTGTSGGRSDTSQKISIKLKKNNGSARITVRDYGPAMDKKTMEHCFEPYFSSKKAGTGLGLPIVKKIVEAHKGSTAIDLPPSGGTSFIITLPLNN